MSYAAKIIQISPPGHNACPPRCEVGFLKSRPGEDKGAFAHRVGVEVDRMVDHTGLEYEYQVDDVEFSQ